MNLRRQVNNPKVWQLITGVLTAVLSYFGYEQVASQAAPDVDVEVIVPEQTTHSHPGHKHKDWLPVIRAEIEKAKQEHTQAHH